MKSNERKWSDKFRSTHMSEEKALNELDELYAKNGNDNNLDTAEKEMLNKINKAFTKAALVRGKSELSKGLEKNLTVKKIIKPNESSLFR